jgi:probable O-glycosylation ligase (exosortase A-associated)
VPVLLALAQTSTSRWERFFERFFAAGVFLRGFTTYSRGGFLAAGVLALLTLVRAERKVRTLIVIGLMLVLVASVMPQQFWDRMQTITFKSEELDASAAGRLHFWQVARAMAADNPISGVGLNAFPVAYGRYNVTEAFDGERAVHSIWLGVLAELGYPGLLLFVAIWGGSILSCWRVYRRAHGDHAQRDMRLYAGALMTSLIVYGVAGSFLSHHYNEMAWHFFGLSTALHLVATAEAREPSEEAAKAPLRARHAAMAR